MASKSWKKGDFAKFSLKNLMSFPISQDQSADKNPKVKCAKNRQN
jgi:hypothetical protein